MGIRPPGSRQSAAGSAAGAEGRPRLGATGAGRERSFLVRLGHVGPASTSQVCARETLSLLPSSARRLTGESCAALSMPGRSRCRCTGTPVSIV